jgi:hypothetical protein
MKHSGTRAPRGSGSSTCRPVACATRLRTRDGATSVPAMDQPRDETSRRRRWAKRRFIAAATTSGLIAALYVASVFAMCHMYVPGLSSVYSAHLGCGQLGVYRMEDWQTDWPSISFSTRWDSRMPNEPPWRFEWWFRWRPEPPWRSVFIPLWLPLICSAGMTVVAWRRLRSLRPGVCAQCGYDLAGAPDKRCPECGTLGATAPGVGSPCASSTSQPG